MEQLFLDPSAKKSKAMKKLDMNAPSRKIIGANSMKYHSPPVKRTTFEQHAKQFNLSQNLSKPFSGV